MDREIDNLVDKWSNEDNFFEPSSTYVETDPTKRVYRSRGESDPREVTHSILAAAGLTPVVGIVADIADATLYAREQNFKDMGISLIGAIPILGQFSTAKKLVREAAKSIEAVSTFKRIAKFERMQEKIDQGKLLFANKRWQKAIDKGDMQISKNGEMYTQMSGKNAPIVNVGNVVDMPRYDRFSDYFELMKDMNADAIKVIKKMSPEELKFSKSLQKNPYQAKKLKELILKLDDLLPGD